jgi:GNAT superfamily N-acetyltransferase
VADGLDVTQLLNDLNAYERGGLRALLRVKSDEDPVVEVIGEIVDDDGANAGDLSRHYVRRQGAWVASHTGLYLDPAFQGRGFGRGFHRHSEDVYRRHGISQISLFAKMKGAYAWHTEGFKLAGPPERRRQHCIDIWEKWGGRERAAKAVQEERVAQAAYDGAASEFSRVSRQERDPMEPDEIARLGADARWRDDDGREMWLGRLILTDSQWVGVKQI